MKTYHVIFKPIQPCNAAKHGEIYGGSISAVSRQAAADIVQKSGRLVNYAGFRLQEVIRGELKL